MPRTKGGIRSTSRTALRMHANQVIAQEVGVIEAFELRFESKIEVHPGRLQEPYTGATAYQGEIRTEDSFENFIHRAPGVQRPL